MKQLAPSVIKEIAEQMDCGLRCFRNKQSNNLVFLPAELDYENDEDEYWQNEIDELANNNADYTEIEKPDSNNSFKIMEEFANSNLIDSKLKDNLLQILQLKKPFANFKNLIDNSDFREEWFAFKSNWMQNWVKNQLDID
jgi:trans-aconitate methyltransferase